MINKLSPIKYDELRQLVTPLNHHLTLHSIIVGITPAEIYVDQEKKPKSAVVLVGEKVWLLGFPLDPFVDELLETLEENYFPSLHELDEEYFRLYYDERWGSMLDIAFPGLEREEYPRSYYHLNAEEENWDAYPPKGYEILRIDKAFLSSNRRNLEKVKKEMVSERSSLEEFLNNSFGFAVVCGNEIVSWCMSEYNFGDRCELGIETLENHQRKGLATQVAKAAIGHAVRKGINKIGCHCWARNNPSIRTALKIGFTHRLNYPICEVKPD